MKKNKLIIFILVACIAPIFPVLYAHAGTRVWGPVKFVRGTGAPVTQFANFTTNPKGEFWIRIANGGDTQNVSSAVVMLNDTTIATPNNFNQQVPFITKDVTLQAQNTISVKLAGAPGSYLELSIFRKSEENLNPGVSNAAGDIIATNEKSFILFMWEEDDKASQYVIYKGYSQDGPWTEFERSYKGEPTKDTDFTSDAATRDVYYEINALDDYGDVIRHYAPIRVPKYRTLEEVQ